MAPASSGVMQSYDAIEQAAAYSFYQRHFIWQVSELMTIAYKFKFHSNSKTRAPVLSTCTAQFCRHRAFVLLVCT